MSSLFIRRLLVWGLSLVLGVVLSLLIMAIFLPAVSPNPNEGAIGIDRYGIQYFIWTAGPIALIFVTIFDHFFETKIWPD
jgi:hypothetical protein